MMPEIFDILLSFLTLTILEIVLGIDNLVFLAIISQRLPKSEQKRARQIGLTLAWVLRIILLGSAVWITSLTTPLFTIENFSFSGRDLFLLLGGLFLLYKATQEIHNEVELNQTKHFPEKTQYKKFPMVVTQIAILDLVFSLDSVLTALGLTQRFWLMSLSITIAILTMVFASEPLSRFIERHPSIKMLALSYLILIGTLLVTDAFHFEIPRGYVYFAMGFSLLVECLNLLKQKRGKI